MDLDAFIGEWSIEAGFAGAPTGTVEFEWMAGGKFVVQRWEVPVPEAPDGLAIIGLDEDRQTYHQHKDVLAPAAHRLYLAAATQHFVLDPRVEGVDERTEVTL